MIQTKAARTKWFYNRFIKAQYDIESSIHLEKDMNDNTIFVVSIGAIYVRIRGDEVICSNPKDSTIMIVDYVKLRYPEYFL